MAAAKTIRKTKSRDESIALGERIVKMYQEHHASAGKIARDLGCSRQAVYYHLERFGVKRRKMNDYFQGD